MKKLSLFLVAIVCVLVSCKPDPEPEKPTVMTKSVEDVTETTVHCLYEIVSIGSCEYLESSGVCWGTSQNPTINDNYKEGYYGSCIIYDLSPNTTYYVRAYATNVVGTSYGEEICFTTRKDFGYSDGEINGHAYVDLGLSSGLKWATCNLGANSCEERGVAYRWGSITENGEYYSEMEDISGNIQYDAATSNWGASWRMPSESEFKELIDECECSLVFENGIKGYKFAGVNGASIFLPVNEGIMDLSCYWTSTPLDDEYVKCLMFADSYDYIKIGGAAPSFRFCIRPVSE